MMGKNDTGDPIKLTDQIIKHMKAPHPSGVTTIIWDTYLPGLGVQISGKTNAKSFIARYKLPHNKARDLKIGPTNIFDLSYARERAKDLLSINEINQNDLIFLRAAKEMGLIPKETKDVMFKN